jgi:anti-sigma-K factor RskA
VPARKRHDQRTRRSGIKDGDLEAMLERSEEAFEDLVQGKKSSRPFVLLRGRVAKQVPSARL